MNIFDLRIGMKVELGQRKFGFREWGRVEVIGDDYAVVRADDEKPQLIEAQDLPDLRKYKEGAA